MIKKCKEVVHHLDFNRCNNKVENLYLFSNNGVHISYHNFLVNLIKGALT